MVLCDIRGMMPAVCELLFLEESAQQDMYGLDWFKAAWQRVGKRKGERAILAACKHVLVDPFTLCT